jgi:F-type H+-transporting ATPase subunit delta
MNISRISVRYAKAIFDLALEQNIADKVNEDMKLIYEVASNPDFIFFLENPVLFPSKKQQVFIELFKDRVQELSLQFFKLLSENKREVYLKAIARNYFDNYRKHFGIKSAELVTAFAPDQKLKDEVTKILSKVFDSKIELKDNTDETLVAGFILTVEGMQYDASVSSKLKDIKNDLLN